MRWQRAACVGVGRLGGAGVLPAAGQTAGRDEAGAVPMRLLPALASRERSARCSASARKGSKGPRKYAPRVTAIFLRECGASREAWDERV